MAIQNKAVESAGESKLSHTVDSPEFITRLAEDMKTRSGSDLPLSCFVEQVKMQLAGKSPSDVARMTSDRPAKLTPIPTNQSSDCFRSWAMPD